MRVGTLEIQLLASMAQITRDMKQAERIVGTSMSQVERSVAGAKRAMQSLGVGIPVALIVDQVRRITDQYTKLDAQLQLTTKSQAQYAQGLSDIRRISTIAQTDISATSMLYTRLMNVMDGMGVSQAKIATVTETVSYGLKAYGATAQEAASASLQLSQAMGANRLGGEEFRAVMEAMPNVMKVLAKSMNVPLGELRALSIAGKITADEMVKAFGDPAIAEEFRKLALNAQTVTGAWTVARNELMLLVGEFMKSSGATGGFIAVFNGLAESIKMLGEYMRTLIFLAGTYAAAMAGQFVVSMVMAIEKSIALADATAMNAAMNVKAAQQEASLAAARAASASANAASTVSLLRNTLVTVEATAVTAAKTAADHAAAVAQLNHARAAGLLSGHLYIVRQVEAELVIATQALAVAQTELSVATARQTRLQAGLVAADRAATVAKAQLTTATEAVVVAQNAATASTLGNIAAIAAALRAAALAHPITAAALAIGTIIVAIANWDSIVNGSKASFTWFNDTFLAGLQFLAMGVGISLGELVQKMSLLATVTLPQLKSGEFKKQWDELGKIAEQSRINAAAKIAGIDAETVAKEDMAAVVARMKQRDEWDKLTNTKAQQRTAEIDALNVKYRAIIEGQTLSSAQQLAEAERYNVALANINEKYGKAALKAAAKDQKELRAMQAASVKYQQDIVDGINAETDALVKKIEQERFDLAAIGKTQEELALLQAVRYDNVTSLQEQKLATLESVFASEEEIAALREQIKARKELKGVWSAQATAQAQETQKKAWKEVWDSVDKTAHDTFVSILNGSKDTATRLKEAFKNGFFDWLYSMTLKKWVVNISGVAGGAGASGMASAAGMDGGGGAMSWLSAGKSMYDMANGAVSSAITKGFTELAGSSFGQSMGWSQTTTSAGGVQMQSLSDAGMQVNAGLNAIGNAAAGYMLQKTISGEYKIGNGKIVDALTLAASAYFGPVAGIVAGIANRAFGMGAKTSGTTSLVGTASQIGFEGSYQTPWSQKGGWFRSNKSGVDVQGIGAEQAQAFQDVIAGTEFVFAKLAAVSGEATTALDNWSFAINRQVSTQEQQNQLVIDIANSMGAHMIPRLSQFQKEGENLADTAVRLSDEVILLNKLFYALGSTSRATMDSADQLANALGGVANSAQLMTSFISGFAPAAQQTALTLEALTASGLPMAEFLTTTEAWWAFAQTASTEQLTAILANQGAIQSWVDAMEQSSQAVKDNIKALQDKAAADFKAASDAVASLRTFGASVRDLMRSLRLGAQAPGGVSYGATRADFLSTNAAAVGDVAAQGRLASSAIAFLDASRAKSVSEIEYARDFALVQNALGATADANDTQVTVADAQLTVLELMSSTMTSLLAETTAGNMVNVANLQESYAALLSVQNEINAAKIAGTLDVDVLRGTVIAATAKQISGVDNVNQSVLRITDPSGGLITASLEIQRAIDLAKVTGSIDISRLSGIVSAETLRQIQAVNGVSGTINLGTLQQIAASQQIRTEVINGAGYTAKVTDTLNAATNPILDEMSTWLGSINAESTIQTSSLEYLLSAAIATNQAAADAVNAQRAQAAADKAAADKAIADAAILSDAQAALSVLISEQAGIISGVNSGIAGIAALAAQYGVTLQGSGGGAATFEVDNGKFAADYASILGLTTSDFAGFRSQFYSAGGVYDQTYGQAGALSAATTEIEAQRELIRSMGVMPAFAVGTNSVPYDMVAQIHAGEEITPRPYVDRQSAERAETNKLLRRMAETNDETKRELSAVKLELVDIKRTNRRMMQIDEDWDVNGTPEVRAA